MSETSVTAVPTEWVEAVNEVLAAYGAYDSFVAAAICEALVPLVRADTATRIADAIHDDPGGIGRAESADIARRIGVQP